MGRKHRLEASLVLKRSIVIDGLKTSVGMEEPFWTAFKEIAVINKMPIRGLASQIKKDYRTNNLSSAIRMFVLNHYRGAWGERKGGP
jgi:predicted DNA-binding ribbon-helix-helix protein